MKFLLSAILFISFCSVAQDPRRIYVEVLDSMKTRKDAYVKIIFSSKNGRPFLLPDKISVGKLTDIEAIFQIQLQKKEGRHTEYFSNYPPKHSQGFYFDSIRMIPHTSFALIDSLHTIGTLDPGSYRLRVLYNKRPIHGPITNPNFILSSNWYYFTVVNEIILWRY
jgi:hypothetical protein